jgi:phospholipase/carboxylesterase
MNMEHLMQRTVADTGLPLLHRVRPPLGAKTEGAPCLVLLHGVGANEANLIDLAAEQDPRLTVILARGPVVFGPDQFGWFNVRFTPSGPVIDAAQAEQSRQALVAFIEGLPKDYGTDPGRIWIAGFSQGGIMSASVGLTRPDRVAGFGLLSGRILPEIAPLIAAPEALARLDGFVSHGIDDSKLPIDFARGARRLLTEKGVRLAYREYASGHGLDPAMRRDFAEWLTQRLDASAG